MPTFTQSEILLDVIKGFTKNFPALNRMGTDFTPNSLKLNQTYTAHIPTIPTVDDVSTTYATTGNAARSLLVDVPITVDKHKAVPLYWSHFDAIKDQKNRYDEVINLAGYALAKAVIDDLLSGVSQGNFSYSSTYAEADCDADMLINVTGDLNGQGALPTGRVLLCNTAVAGALSGDSRITSKDYAGQIVQGNGLRRWTNTHGFAEIIEYADFPTNNGTSLTGLTGVASTDVFTKASHGLNVGDTVTLPALTGGSGLTASATTRYFVATVPTANTFTLVTSAGAAVNFTTDITDGTVAKTENLAAFAFDMRAFALMAGVPENFDQEFLAGLNIPRTMGYETVTDPESGITMAAVSWQEYGTGKLVWAPTLVWGKALGRQGYSNTAGAKCDKAGHRVITA